MEECEKKVEDCKEYEEKFSEVLMKLPPNYPVNVVYVNGMAVNVWAFLNGCPQSKTAYFMDEDCQVIPLDSTKIDGISFIANEEGD